MASCPLTARVFQDAMNRFGGTGLWDNETGFYYDQLQMPDGTRMMLRVRSMVGLVPLFSVSNFSVHDMCNFPGLAKRTEWFLRNRKVGRIARFRRFF